MIRSTLRIVATAFSLAVVFNAAALAAGEPARPVLKAQATVTGPIVRVGDLVANAGVIANVPIFRAPDLGATGTVPASAVADAVAAHALIGLDTAGLDEVTVTRTGRAIAVSEISAAIARALSVRFNLGEAKDIEVSLDRDPRVIYVEPNALGTPRVSYVSFDRYSGRFDATVAIPTGAATHGDLRLAGHAVVTSDVLVVSHAIERGALIKASDLTVERRPRNRTGSDSLSEPEAAVGMAARNPLLPGRLLRAADLMKPLLVERNAAVTLVYQVPGISLTVRGKAAEAGAEGDTISVINEQSKRTLQGVVIGPGRVLVSAGSPRLAANISPTASIANR